MRGGKKKQIELMTVMLCGLNEKECNRICNMLDRADIKVKKKHLSFCDDGCVIDGLYDIVFSAWEFSYFIRCGTYWCVVNDNPHAHFRFLKESFTSIIIT